MKQVKFRMCMSVAMTFFFLSCTKSSNDNTAPTTVRYTWEQKGPTGGFVSSVKYHPTNSCEVWASGDDMSGLYKSIDCGSSWSLIKSTPLNMSTYDLEFNPLQSNQMYAINHFGRGLLKSGDAGATWTLSQSGLPQVGSAMRVYELTIDPTDSATSIAATYDGLYRSTDNGASFSKIAVGWGAVFQTAEYDSTGRLFAGASNGVVKYSDDDGQTWTDVVAAGAPVSQIRFSTNAIYILFSEGTLLYILKSNYGISGILNNSATGFTATIHTRMAVLSGASQGQDTIYVGTDRTGSVATNRWGLFKSVNGGGSWTQMTSAVAGQSIFTIDINPNNSNEVIVGTSNSAGLFRTQNGGTSWASISTGVYAHTALGFVQSKTNPQFLIMSSTVGLGFSQSLYSNDKGATWSSFSDVVSNDGTISWAIQPSNNNIILAGTLTKGAYRSSAGVNGPWTRVIATDSKVEKFFQDRINENKIYALATFATPLTDARLYYSNNGGTSFTVRAAKYATNGAANPHQANEAIITNLTGLFSSNDGFASSNSLGLAAEATAQGGLSAVAFDSQVAGVVYVGGVKGGIFKTTNYTLSGSGISWTALNSPIQNAIIRQLAVHYESGQKVLYVSGFESDIYYSLGSTLGLWRSLDEGSTWTEVSSTIFPCNSFWGFEIDQQNSSQIWGQTWGGGLNRLTIQ